MKGPFNTALLFIALEINLGIALPDEYLRSDASMQDNVKITCYSDEQCEEMNYKGYKCIDNVCTCKDKHSCRKSELKPLVTKIGRNCTDTVQCNIEQSFCNSDGFCQCSENTVSSKDRRRCMNVITEIGLNCEEDAQCTSLNGMCVDGKCDCPVDMHIRKGICHNNTEIGAFCETHKDCYGIDFSTCKNNTCVCEKKYVQSAINSSKCLLKARNLLSGCSEQVQCSSSLGPGSVCSNGLCICIRLYHFKSKSGKCVRDALLGESCASHSECHQPGVDRHEKSRLECLTGACKCKQPYYEAEEQCVLPAPDSAESLMTLRFSAVLPFVFSYFMFYVIV